MYSVIEFNQKCQIKFTLFLNGEFNVEIRDEMTVIVALLFRKILICDKTRLRQPPTRTYALLTKN